MPKKGTLASNAFDGDDSYSTQTKFLTFRLKWTVENYDFVAQNLKSIQSHDFPSNKKEIRKWFIELEPVELNKDHTSDGKIFLKRRFSGEIHIRTSLSLHCTSGKSYAFGDYNGILHGAYISWNYKGMDVANYLLWENQNSKDLKLTCKVTMFDSAVHICRNISSKNFKAESLLENISNFYDDHTFKDFTFLVQGKEFRAHKAILAARSSVFAAMFTHNMSELMTSTVEIEDIKPRVFQKMLRFIYTDEIYGLDKMPSELLAAAEKYDLKKLKEMCIKVMHTDLCIENVLEILQVADLYSIVILKNTALEFIASHLNAVKHMYMEKFETLIESLPHLATELFKIQKSLPTEEEETVTKATFDFRKNQS